MINRRNFVIRAAGGLGMLAISPATFGARLNENALSGSAPDKNI